MEPPLIKKEDNAFKRLNDDVLRLILQGLYEACLRDFDRLEAREKQNKAVRMLLPLGYTSRDFAKLVLPYVWKYVRIVTNKRRSYNIEISDILRNDNLSFPYGEYLKDLEINFTVYSGDERCRELPTISSLLQVIANRCTNIQQLNFLAKVDRRNFTDELRFSMHDEGAAINRAFKHILQTKTKWNNFKDLVSKAFGQGSLVEVTLSSDFILMDDICLIDIAKSNPGIRKLSLRGSQFTHSGIEIALQCLGDNLKELEIYNLLGDGSTKASSPPLRISIDSLLRPCRNLQSIHLVGVKYSPSENSENSENSEKYVCPLRSIKLDQVDEETINHLFSLANKQTLFQVIITSSYDVVKWDTFLRSFILPFATEGSIENLILFILRCQNHRYSSRALNSIDIMKNIMNTLKISENTANLLRLKLKQWEIYVGRDTGDQMYSVESEGVDFVSRTCILNYDRLALSEHY